MALAPSALVLGPTRVPLPYGLFSTFTFRGATGDRWGTGGVQFETVGCGPLGAYGGPECDPTDPLTPVEGLPSTFERSPGMVGEATSFTIYGYDKCSLVGNADPMLKAQERLLTHEERSVEYAFWTGALGNTPSLQGATELTSGPVSWTVGIGLLEEFIAREYGSQGVIHMSRLTAIGAKDVQRTGASLRTLLGTPIAAGAGYDGSSPQGATPPANTAQRWVYITPPLFGYRSEIYSPTTELGEMFDRDTNTVTALSQRDYLLAFEECGVAAVLIDTGLDAAAANVSDMSDPAPYLIT